MKNEEGKMKNGATTSADCQSAIQQGTTLRYGVVGGREASSNPGIKKHEKRGKTAFWKWLKISQIQNQSREVKQSQGWGVGCFRLNGQRNQMNKKQAVLNF